MRRQMTEADHRAIAEVMNKGVRKTFVIGEPGLPPMLTGFQMGEEGKVEKASQVPGALVGILLEAPDLMSGFIDRALTHGGWDAMVHVHEAWSVERELPPGGMPDEKDMPMPSECPDRREIVMIHIASRGLTTMMRIEIHRDGEKVWLDDETFVEVGGEVHGRLICPSEQESGGRTVH